MNVISFVFLGTFVLYFCNHLSVPKLNCLNGFFVGLVFLYLAGTCLCVVEGVGSKGRQICWWEKEVGLVNVIT